jgi:pseudouridine-5'-phosphate glycosidase
VALETTLVTHGFPSSEGLEVASELEEIVRSAGAVPATIGVLGGHLIVGLTTAELQRLAESPTVAKLNLSNLAAGITSGKPGSTTVAATLVAAHRAGIRVMATGGIGGVHRQVTETGDVSADLIALSRFPVAVVCAGAKAVLDLPRSMEALETLGVPVYGFGTDHLPAFYRRDSGLPLDQGFDSLEQLGIAIRLHFELGAGSGVVVANPIPPEHEMPQEIYERALNRSLTELLDNRIRGREVTPFLLARLRELTEGKSSFSNRALLLNNAQLAGRLAARVIRSGF